MRAVVPFTASIALSLLALLAVPSAPAAAQHSHEPPSAAETHEHQGAVGIPKAVLAEHEAIHSALVDATRAKGPVGVAAKALAEVLHPHFVREEQIALPPLGLLAPLAAGERLEEAMKSALAMSDSLRAELPGMLQEHVRIRAAVGDLLVAARAAKNVRAESLAEELALHASTEEEVLYPAAILVGEVIRARLAEK